MDALVFTKREGRKVIKFFGNGARMSKGETSVVIPASTKCFKDTRENTIEYRLYKYSGGFKWRRVVTSNHRDGKIPYQLFKYGRAWHTYQSYPSINKALERFIRYAENQNMLNN